ncbi:MAG TPA: RHS repeat-associated core domain-containing protein [Candidatus Dormibacteraeota bacterium]|nr:RHS repeat-associated core domain-containing protein [Candidatus Dormibacteraeota bacterium]
MLTKHRRGSLGRGGDIRGLTGERRSYRSIALTLGVAAGLLLPLLPQGVSANDTHSKLTVRGSISSISVNPNLSLTLAVDKSTAIPGDTLAYSGTVTHTGITACISGSVSAQNTGGATATVADFFDEIDYWDPNALKWVPLAGVARTQTAFVPVVTPRISTGITLTVTSVPANGVTYPSSGDPILGTTIASGATAAWTGSICLTLTAAQLNALFNAPKIRVERHVEDTPGDPSGESWTNDQDSFNPLRSGFLNARNVVVTVTPPSGPSVQITSSTVPAFASLAPGASANYATTYRVPAATSRGSSETEAAYLLRLTHLEGSSLKASASVAANGPTGSVSANAPPVTTIEHLPIVTIAKTGPATVTAGTTATYPLALNNAGGAAASGIAMADTVPGGANGTVSGNPGTLAPGASSTGVQATFAIPVSQSSGNLTDTATVNWLDANGNPYGSLSSAFTTVVQNTLQGATLTLALPPGSAGLNPVNGSQVVLISLLNSGGSPIPVQLVTVNVTGVNPITLTATTDVNGQASATYSGKTQGVDQLQATASSASITVQSNTVSVTWIAPIEPVSTTPAQGTFFAESASAQMFLAKPGDPAAFQQTFPTINFNPPANTIPHNVSGVDPTTRPFTDVTTDAVGNFAGTIVAQGNGLQAGMGTLTGFNAVLTANFIVSQPQDVTFNIVADDGFMLGVGGGASRVSGTLVGAPASGLTPFNSYQIVGAYNQAGGAAPATYAVTVHFPSAGAYSYEIDYFECCGSQLSLTMTVVSVNTGPYNLSTGYADTTRPAGLSTFPFPWNGAANTTFIGGGAPYDTGGLRFDNNTNQAITLNHVTADIGTHHYDPWNLNLAIPANGTLILANPTGSVFDTSESGGTGTNPGSGGGSGGFVAAPFATGFNTMGSLGPIGVAFDNGGNLFVMNYATGVLYKFGPGGGVAGPATQVSANGIFGCQTSISASSGLAFSKDGKHLYLAQQCSGQVLEVDQTTGVVIRTVASGIPYATGIATDPVSGDLFVTEPSFGHDDVIRVSNPTSANPTVAPYAHPGSKSDGIAFGPDGTLYVSVCCSAVEIIAGTNASVPGTILAYISNAALAGNDGIALLPPPPGAVGESIVVNSNNGFIVEIDNPLTPNPTFHNIVTGGSRGDFVAVGPDHCLYATQIDNVEKVTSTDGTCPFAPSICLSNPAVPQVHVTINGFTFDYNDTGLALTGGIDGECTGNNESQAWQQIGGKGGPVNIPLPPAVTLALQAAPSGGHIVGRSQAFTVAAMDGGGQAVPNVAVQLGVFGANPQQLSGTTDASGTATFSYTGANSGTDTVTATALINGLRTVSNAVAIQWTVPAPGGPTGGTSGPAPPSVVVTAPADGTAVSQPVPITATIRAPPSSPISSWNVLYQNVNGGSFVTLASGTGNPPATLATFDPTGLTAGTYAITVNATTAANGFASAIVRVIVGNGGGTTAQTPPTIGAPSPADGSIVTKPVPITATITPPAGQTVASWSVSYQSQSQGTLVTILNGTGSPPTPIATFDPTLLPNDTYTIMVSATASGGGTQTVTATLAVSGGLKLGRYTTTYQDLNVPVNGFQMQVQRTYDSIDKRVGDFGIGWHLGLTNFRVSANRQLGARGWTEYPTSCIFGLCFYAFKTATPHYVTVTFPDQHQEIFDFTPQGGAGLLYWQGSAAFTARPGTGTTSTLEVAGDGSLSYDFAGNLVGGSGYFNPTRFKLTTHDGRVLILDTTLGLVSETDRNGNSITVDASGVHASNGQGILFTRDSLGRITQVVGPAAGQNVTYTYSGAGDLSTSTDPLGNSNTYSYDLAHNLLQVIGAQGALSTAGYDSAGRLISIMDANGHTTQIQNNVGAQTMAYTDAIGLTTTLVTADDLGDVVREDISSGGQTLTTRFAYDAVGHVTKKTDALGHAVYAEYDALGNLTRYLDGAGNPMQFFYDDHGQITSIVAADGATVASASYDTNGNPTMMLGPAGAVSRFTYDSAGRVRTRADAAGNAIGYAYDAMGRMSGITGPTGKTTAFQYDAGNRLTLMTDTLGNAVHFTYDGAGNPIGITDGRGNSESFTYNSFGQALSVTDPIGAKATVTYDADGNVTGTIDRAGNSTSYTYDTDNRLVQVNYPGGEFLALTRDGFGRATTLANSSSSTDNSFDAAGHLIATTAHAPVVGSVSLVYTYDAAGRRLTATGPDGTASYTYDSRSRVTRVTDPRLGHFDLQYDSVSRVTSLTRPNGITDSYSYDANGRLAGIASTLGGTTIQNLTQTFDSNGQVASRTDAAGTTAFTHGADGRLVGVSAPGSAAQAYGYDAAGNRTSGPLSATSTYNAADELTSDAGFTYTYDTEGQRTSKTDRTSLATTRFLYNGAKQLTSIQYPDGTTTSYTYDPLGRRSTVSAGGVTTGYVYDGVNARLEYGSGGLAASYLNAGDVDRPLEMTRGAASYYYLQNFQGSVTGLTDGSGTVAATYSADAFGVPTSPQASVTNPFTYTGREYDAKSGLYYNRARYYEPTTGSFISQDPIKSGQRYGYATGDPVDFTDPSGTTPLVEFAAIQKFFTSKSQAALATTACGLSVVSATVEVGMNFATHNLPNEAGVKALLAGVETSCVMATLTNASTPLSTLIIKYPLVAGAIAAVVDLYLQLQCAAQTNNWSNFNPTHAIAVGLAGVSVGAASAVLSRMGDDFAVGLGVAILSGELSGIYDTKTQGGACG